MKRALLIIISILVFIQFFRIDKTNELTSKDLEIKAPENIMVMLKNACYDCHSNETKWPWYSNIAPFHGLLVLMSKMEEKHLIFLFGKIIQKRKKLKK